MALLEEAAGHTFPSMRRFGTHGNGPASVELPSGELQLLSDYLKATPAVLGFESSDGSLPYLMKVLSVAKALSIQSHPDKALAEKLHATRPDVYKDPNHKPEMALALTDFEGMCGFRALENISAQIHSTPALRAALGISGAALQEACNHTDISVQRSSLKGAFSTLMNLSTADVLSHTAALTTWLQQKPIHELSSTDALALRLSEQFPGDVGIFAPYLLNHVSIRPGEAFFMAANEPHAYLAGDCVECMACSDNVVRAGLTPKLRDVDTLVDMLTYNTGEPGAVQGQSVAPGVCAFVPPVPDFAVDRCVAQAAGEVPVCHLPSSDAAAILLVVQGTGAASVSGGATAATGGAGGATAALTPGTVWLQPAGTTASLTASGDGPLIVFRARRNAAAAGGGGGAGGGGAGAPKAS
jgi:mannose-6-phosphate isomerase